MHLLRLRSGSNALVGGPGAPFTTYRVGDGFLNVQLDPEHAPIAAIWGRVIFWVADVDAMYDHALEEGYHARDGAGRRALG